MTVASETDGIPFTDARTVARSAASAPVTRICTGAATTGGKSRAIVSFTARDGAEAGSARVSMPPKWMRSTGAASTPSTISTPIRYTHGRRMTLCARRAQAAPPSVAARFRRNDSALIRSPRIARPAGSTVSDATIATMTAAIAP